jgi:hypothetical protein
MRINIFFFNFFFPQYPVIGVDGRVTVYNPVTRLPSGYLHAVLALGTEDQVRLLEATRSLGNNSDSVQTTSVGKLTSMVPMPAIYDSSDGIQTASLGEVISMEPLPATYDNDHSIQAAFIGEHTSVEPFPCSVVNHHVPIFSGNSKSQSRHINNSSSVISKLPQSFCDHTYALESFQQYSYHNSDRVPTLDTQEHDRSVTVDVRDLTESLPNSSLVSHEVNDQQEQKNNVEFRQNLFDNVERRLSFKNAKTVISSDLNSCAVQNQRPSLAFNHPADRKEQYPQAHGFQYSADKLMVKHYSVGSSGTKDISQPTGGQQVKEPRLQSKGDQTLRSGAGQQTHDIFNAKMITGHSIDQQELQADLPVLDVTSSETVTLQNSSRSTETCELPSDLPLDIIYEACYSSNEVLNMHSSDIQSPSFSQNVHTDGVSSKELSSQSTDVSSQVPAELKNDLNDDTGPVTSKITCSESERTDFNRDDFLGIDGRASEARQLFSVLDNLEASESTEVGPESNFHAHVEIERAMHLQCYMQHEGDETAAGDVTEPEPSTYVTFFHEQGHASESELQMFTPLASHSANPSWCWHCDTWLSSDLLTNVSVL